MKSYLKCTVTTHFSGIKVFALKFSKGHIISELAQSNLSVLVEEAICHEDAYNDLNWIN